MRTHERPRSDAFARSARAWQTGAALRPSPRRAAARTTALLVGAALGAAGCAAGTREAPREGVAHTAVTTRGPSDTTTSDAVHTVASFPAGEVVLAAVRTEGDGELDANRVRMVLRRAEPALRRCYLAALARRPGLRGRMQADFTVRIVGTVGDVVRTQAPPGEAALGACVEGAFRSLVFPQPEGGALRVTLLLDLLPFDE